MKKKLPLKPILITLCALVLLYTVLGFFLVPVGIRKALESGVEAGINGTFAADAVRFNPYTLEMRITGAGVQTGEDSPLMSIDSVYVNLSAESLFKLAPVIDDLRIDAPKLTLSTDKAGNLTLPINTDSSGKEEEKKDGTIFGFRLSNLMISNGELAFTDGVRQTVHHVRDFSLGVPLVSSLEKEAQPVKAAVSLTLNDAAIKAEADLEPFGPDIRARVHVEGTDMALAAYLPYVPVPKALKVTSAGSLSWNLDLGYDAGMKRDGGKTDPGVSVKGNVSVKGIAADLREKGPLARIPGLTVKIDTPDLLGKGVGVALVRVDQPEVFLERDASGQLGLLSLIPAGSKKEEAAQKTGEGSSFALVLGRAEVAEAKVHLRDGVPENGFETLLSPVSVHVDDLRFEGKNLGLTAGGEVVTAAGETLTMTASLDQNGESIGVEGRLALEKGSPMAYAVYLAPFTKGLVSLDRIDVASDFSLTKDAEGIQGTTKAGSVSLGGFRLGAPDEKDGGLVVLPLAEVRGIRADLAARELHIGSAQASRGKVVLGIDKEGQINLLEELAPLMEGEGGPAREPSSNSTSPWQVFLDEAGVKGWAVAFQDDGHGSGPVKVDLSDITFTGQNLTTRAGAEAGRIKGELKFQDSGKFSMDGTLDLAGRTARLNLDLAGIGINTFEPYFTDYLNIDIGAGNFGAKTTVSLAFPEGKQPALAVSGKAGVSDFSSKDKITGNDFFRCKSLFVSGMDISLWPIRVEVKDISLTDFYSRAILTESGELNLKTILAKPDDSGAGKTQPEAAVSEPRNNEIPPITISNITLQGGHINFTDQFTRPNYTANMTQVAGRVSNLSSRSTEPADVVLKGVHGLYSPLDITGKILPFGEERMADVNLSFKNIELTQFNAYAEKYLGYQIETGKLILTLDYHIRGNQLESSNRVFFDQFNLGDKVDNDTATGLPVQLAISLLKNSDDQIDLDIPVHGDLNDPDFSFANVAGEAVKNLIVGVVSAPFKLLGKVFGGFDGGELEFVEFDPGDEILDEGAKTKLDRLAEILSEKEKLSFVIEGKYDADLDAEALRSEKYETNLLALAGAEAKKEILENPEKRLALTEQLYAVADFPKPRDEKGKEKEISSEEMEKLLLTNTAVSQDDLIDLAGRRGKLVMDYLAQAGPIDPGRLFLQTPGPVEEGEKEGQRVRTVFKVE